MTMVMQEQMEHKMNQNKSILFPQKFSSIMLDGLDQSAFVLPLFEANPEHEQHNALKFV